MNSKIQDLCKLLNHPFEPPGVKREYMKTLDPRFNSKVLKYYFDVYDWRSARLIEGIDHQDCFIQFPEDYELNNNPWLILTYGFDSSGISSLQNLIIHKVELEWERESIVVNFRINNARKPDIMLGLARSLINVAEVKGLISMSDLEKLDRIYNQEKETGLEIFTRIEPYITELIESPLIFLVSGHDDNDVWESIYDSLSILSNQCILLIRPEEEAWALRSLEDMYAKGKNVSLIRSKELGKLEAKELLMNRLNAERGDKYNSFQNNLFPFSDDFFDLLFEKGKNTSIASVTRTVGNLKKYYHSAFKYYLRELDRDSSLTIDSEILSKVNRSIR